MKKYIEEGVTAPLSEFPLAVLAMASAFSLQSRREAGILSDTAYWKGTRGELLAAECTSEVPIIGNLEFLV